MLSMQNITDTTGTYVVACDCNLLNPTLYEDTGAYEGALEGVRSLRTIRSYPHLSFRDLPDKDGYGCGWGTGRLYPVTAEQIEQLDKLESERAIAAADRLARRDAADRAEGADRRAHPDKYPCPRCGTYCCGDCGAAND